MDIAVLKTLASEQRLRILGWLKEPRQHFREQVYGDLVEDGVCGLLIAEKLGVTAPTLTGHMKLLTDTGMVRGRKIRQWTFYKRDETRIREIAQALRDSL